MSAPVPEFDDLEAVLADVWRRLAVAADDRGSQFRTPVLATLTQDGLPSARVVILRSADPAARVLEIYSDARSQKIRELELQPSASLLFYDSTALIQLRLTVRVTVLSDSATVTRAWEALGQHSRRDYQALSAPASPLAAPGSGLADSPMEQDSTPEQDEAGEQDETGRRNFRVLSARVESLDWLRLSNQGHRRARFSWNGPVVSEATWLVP